MAEDVGQPRTEAPTPRRREEARQQGQVAVSNDLNTGLLLLAGVVVLWWGLHGLSRGLVEAVRADVLGSAKADLTVDSLGAMFLLHAGRAVELIGFVLGALFVAGVATGVLQAGFHFVPGLVGMRWDRLSPAQGWQKFFSLAAGLRALMAVLKVAAVLLLAWIVLRGRTEQIRGLGQGALTTSLGQAGDILFRLAAAIAAGLVIIGFLDFVLQRFRLERSLRMTRQELKEELRLETGDPEIRARIRKLQREVGRRRMMEDVPRATVVLTNPIHLAVALRYERGATAAPQVVAKGAGEVARKIVERARRHGVPIVERKPLAQALFKAVRIGQQIPAALYIAVAEVLAFVFRQRSGAATA
jgi:flagellar biosynthetic protein FlhB